MVNVFIHVDYVGTTRIIKPNEVTVECQAAKMEKTM
jgi:hypothetical protein